uniref:Uncharacterized protein n=1 Tax=Glossina brevipalpis TaxID=37001 RepID=A0A1A9WIR5_9MUSC
MIETFQYMITTLRCFNILNNVIMISPFVCLVMHSQFLLTHPVSMYFCVGLNPLSTYQIVEPAAFFTVFLTCTTFRQINQSITFQATRVVEVSTRKMSPANPFQHKKEMKTREELLIL